MPSPGIEPGALDALLRHYDLGGGYVVVAPAGGTANANVLVRCARGKVFCRRRSRRYSSEDQVVYEHAVMRHLAAKGIGGPRPLRTRDGGTWVRDGEDVYEVACFVEGTAFKPQSLDQLRAAGEGLAAFHEALDDFVAPVPKDLPRYDDPKDIRAGYESLLPQATAEQGRGVQRVLRVVAKLERDFPDAMYEALPHCIIHGDYHPANVLFVGNRLAGIFDLDWVSLQPRVRDLSDGLYYFAGRRAARLDGGDIYSLTRGLSYDIPRACVLLDAYRGRRSVTEAELRALPLVAATRWLFSKVAGMRKVRQGERAAFALRDVMEPLDWLAAHGDQLVAALL